MLKSKLPILDFLRGIAAVGVLLHHTVVNRSFEWDTNSIFYQIGMLGRGGVETFFVISGFIIPYSMYKAGYTLRDFKPFFVKRFIRIEPPYLASIVLVLALGYISTLSPLYKGGPFELDFVNILTHIGYLNQYFDKAYINIVYWTLGIELQYYILIALIFPIIMIPGVLTKICLLTLFSLTVFIEIPYQTIFGYTPFFLIGIVILWFKIGQISALETIMMAAGLVTVMIIKFKIDYVACAVVAAFLIVVASDLRIKYAAFFGSISYSLYLTHVPVGGRVINLLSNFTHSELQKYGTVFLSIVISIGFAYVFYLIIERCFLTMSKGIKYGNNIQ